MNDVSVNQQIAEQFGWTVERFQLGDTPVDWFVLRDPERRIQHGAKTDAEAWAETPDYERSLDAVWAVLLAASGAPGSEGKTIELSVSREGVGIRVWLDAKTVDWRVFVPANPPHAAARALLAWATAQNGATP